MSLRPIKILVVEDDIFLGKDLVKKLEGIGYIVTGLVDNKKDAVSIFKSTMPDLVIVDIELMQKGGKKKDRLGGIELVNEITKYFKTPCIYYTGFGGNQEIIEQADKSNHTGILLKNSPFLQVKIVIQSTMNNYWEAERIDSLPSFLYIDGIKEIRSSERKILHRIESKELLWLEYKDSSITFFIAGNEHTVTKKSLQLSTFLKRYPYPFLVRISQSIVINIEKISNIIPDTDEVIMYHNKSEHYLSVGKNFRGDFFRYVSQYKLKSQ